MRRTIVVALTLALVMSACSSTDAARPTDEAIQAPPESSVASSTSPRITPDIAPTSPLYETLELGTPEQAAESLISAYDDRDFVRAWFIFDADAQHRLARSVNSLNFSEFRSATYQLPNNVIEGTGEHADLNNIAMIARFFDDAASLGYLHVDLAGASVESSGSTTDADVAVVIVRLADDSIVRARMTKTPTNRWRANQIALDGVDLDESGDVFVDASCGFRRIRVHQGAECPSSDSVRDTAIDAEVERIRESAGDDIAQQIEAAQQIQALVDGATTKSDEDICAALQGNTAPEDAPVDDELLARATSLLEDTCPGSIELLSDPPTVPPSGGAVGARTAYGRLDLSTPEKSVETFGKLFANEAFMLLFMSLDAQAQRALTRSINNLDVSTIVDPKVLETWNGVESEAHFNTLVGNFASFMIEASRTDLHLLDLSEPFDVVMTRALQRVEDPREPFEAQVVEARSEVLGTVYFLMVESPSGRWRVRQVALDPAAFESLDNSGKVFIAS